MLMERRLAAIMATDVVGYSRLIRVDEEGTIAALQALRADLIDPKIAEHHGRIVKLMGDGMLAEFPSVVDAVRAAVETQEALAEHNAGQEENNRLDFRIGINLGDVVIDGDDIQGDGVNVAARLEGLAQPGGICISGSVHEQVRDRLDLPFDDLGEQEVKNIARPVQVWHWLPEGSAASGPTATGAPLSLPDNPSIAVLPFSNLSSDPEQAYFADGIVEDLITALSRFPWLFVIARNSSFTYKDKSVQVTEVSEELGVRYVVEGSVRSSASRVRVAVQLIDAENSRHVWAENYDRPTGDLFDLQDEITQSITGVLVPALSSAERERSLRSTRPSLDAWQSYQKGLAHYYRPFSHKDHAEAKRLFDHATRLDPNFADAHSMIALMGVYAIRSGLSSYSASIDEIIAEAKRAAEAAVQLEDGNALTHIALGIVNDRIGNSETAISECRTAAKLNPNLAQAHHELGFVLNHAGQLEEAISCFDKAISLSPNDPSRWNFFLVMGMSLHGLGEFDKAIVRLKQSSQLRPVAFWPFLGLAGSYVGLGQMKDAKLAIKEVLARKSDCSVEFVRHVFGSSSAEHLTRMLDHLQIAGLPES